MDAWAQRTGGSRVPFGPNSALAHYIGLIPVADFAIFHAQFSTNVEFSLLALKMLSKRLCVSTIASTANVVILVKKQLAMATFGSGFRGKVLAHTAIGESAATCDPDDIALRIVTGELPLAKRHRTKLVRRLQDA